MRAVADNNVVFSGTFWSGPSGKILRAARSQAIELVTTTALLAELLETLSKPRLRPILEAQSKTAEAWVLEFLAIAVLVQPVRVTEPKLRDPDDVIVLEAAVGGQAEYIITGDRDLLSLGSHAGIEIVTPAAFVLLADLQ